MTYPDKWILFAAHLASSVSELHSSYKLRVNIRTKAPKNNLIVITALSKTSGKCEQLLRAGSLFTLRIFEKGQKNKK